MLSYFRPNARCKPHLFTVTENIVCMNQEFED